jgi:hypothetical protein
MLSRDRNQSAFFKRQPDFIWAANHSFGFDQAKKSPQNLRAFY